MDRNLLTNILQRKKYIEDKEDNIRRITNLNPYRNVGVFCVHKKDRGDGINPGLREYKELQIYAEWRGALFNPYII
jgi:hypothetical protein